MSHTHPFIRPLVLCLGMTLATSACSKDPYDPQTWIPQLDEPTEFQRATTELKQLGCPEAILALGKAWEKYNKSSKILRVIIDLADQPDAKAGQDQDCPDAPDGPYWTDAVEVLKTAVQDVDTTAQREIEDAVVAAEALGKSKDPSAVAVLDQVAKKIFPTRKGNQIRIAALKALGNFGNDPKAIKTLTTILNGDPEKQLIFLNAAAANALAETGSSEAVPQLIQALYEVSPIYQQVRGALTKAGKTATPALIKVFKGEDAAVNELAKKYDFVKKAPGNVKFKSAGLLGDLRASSAVGVLTAGLSQAPKVSFYDPKTNAPGPSDHNAILDALRNIVATKSAGDVATYMKAASTKSDIRPLAVDVYSMIGTGTSELEWLATKFVDATNQDQRLRGASALGYARLVNAKPQLSALQSIITKQVEAANAEDRKAGQLTDAAAKEKAEKRANDYRGFAREYEQHKTRAQVGVACKTDVNCYVELLSLDAEAIVKKFSIPNHRRAKKMKKQDMANYRLAAFERALLEIAKRGQPGKGIHKKLLEHVPATDRFIRQGVLLALPKVAPTPCVECIETLDEVIEKQKDQTTLDFLTKDTKIVRNYFYSQK